jgi:hypothetical protein
MHVRYCLSVCLVHARLGLRQADQGRLHVLGVAFCPCQSMKCEKTSVFDLLPTLYMHTPALVVSSQPPELLGDKTPAISYNIQVSSHAGLDQLVSSNEDSLRRLQTRMHMWQTRVSLVSRNPGNGPPSFL